MLSNFHSLGAKLRMHDTTSCILKAPKNRLKTFNWDEIHCMEKISFLENEDVK